VHDPIDGKRYQGMPKRYVITGFTLFEKTLVRKEVSQYAKASVEKAKAKLIATKWNDPQKVVAGPEVEQMLIKAGIFTREVPQGHVTKEDMIVAFDRLGMLD